jgi:hypothetical protein
MGMAFNHLPSYITWRLVAYCVTEQFNGKQACHCEYKCANCFTLESRLNETLLEISSSQFITKLLQKELNEVIAQRMAGSSTSGVNEACEEPIMPTEWSEAPSKRFLVRMKQLIRN